MARTPAPTALKVVRGSRKDRINTAEPVPNASEVVVPGWLADEARSTWDRLSPELIRKKVLTSWDVDAFGRFCEAVANWHIARVHVSAEGAVVEAPVYNKNGDISGTRLQRNQWWLVMKDADDVLARLGARFGLTPSERAQLKVGDGQGKRPGEDLLTG